MAGTPANALNISAPGLVNFDGVNVFTGVTLTNHYALVGGASNSITSVGPGAAGQVFQSAGPGVNPAYSIPTYPSVSGSVGKILRSDGTNNLYTTATYPDLAGTSGNVLTSDGTNFVSSTPPLFSATVTLTSAQIKALRATPIELVPAPGANKVIVLVQGLTKFVYGGTNAFTNGQNIDIFYNSTTAAVGGSNSISAGQIALTQSFYSGITQLNFQQGTTLTTPTNYENKNITIKNSGASEITGNAGNNNTLTYTVYYTVSTMPAG